MTEAEHEAHVLRTLMDQSASSDARTARRARIALCCLLPFCGGVNREIRDGSAGNDTNVLTDGAAVLGMLANFLCDNLVVRGVSRKDAHDAVLGVISIAMARQHQKREARGETPMPYDECAAKFDFRAMLRGQG